MRKKAKSAKPHCRKLGTKTKELGTCVMHKGKPHMSFDKHGRSLKFTGKTYVNVTGALSRHYH